ncbi:hypothetical protein AURDEDRAFT_164257 [Auricularia subglabra TFB-10046 SS5]|nr:hypothetical protein AURDEDRAFT_164257 [Auricularia subglabra TFB-10046 SS5]
MADLKPIIIEDDNFDHVSYLPQAAWASWNGSNYHNNSYHITQVIGASVTFVFNGSYVAYYSDENFDHGEFDVSLDGNVVYSGTSRSPKFLIQRMLFDSSDFEPGMHTLSVTNTNTTFLGVDYFIYQPLPPTSTLSKISATETTASIARLGDSAIFTSASTTVTPASIAVSSASITVSSASITVSSASISSNPARTPTATIIVAIGAASGIALALIGIVVLVLRMRRSRKVGTPVQTLQLPEDSPLIDRHRSVQFAREVNAPPAYEIDPSVRLPSPGITSYPLPAKSRW